MGSLTRQIKSVRGKLFFTLCIVVVSIILFLIIVNSVVLEKYYEYAKSNQLKNVFATINSYYKGEIQIVNFEDELDQISIKNNFDIINVEVIFFRFLFQRFNVKVGKVYAPRCKLV